DVGDAIEMIGRVDHPAAFEQEIDGRVWAGHGVLSGVEPRGFGSNLAGSDARGYRSCEAVWFPVRSGAGTSAAPAGGPGSGSPPGFVRARRKRVLPCGRSDSMI